jgi:ribonuclease H / adenosylcobalamin/alpha-ribazole phosphatase
LREFEIKQLIRNNIFKGLSSVPEVLSVTLVGSFIDREDLAGISDIDTIVVCDKLNKEVFNKCLEMAKSISLEECGLNGFQLKTNTSFGPLKFDEDKLAVLHLMIYDVGGHRNHVLASPFTCLDWERSSHLVGKSLKEIFPVGKLQPRDFLEARRGMENYLEDLRSGTISIREYDFAENGYEEIKKTHPLDERHRGEFAFHIVRNLMLNFMKLKYNENRLYSMQEMEKGMEELLGENRTKHVNYFRILSKLKRQRLKTFPQWTIGWAEEFITDFHEAFVSSWETARTIYFMRHARTSLNDGTFLGQGRDPSIQSNELSPLPEIIKTVYSSPSKRCLETAKRLAPELQSFPDKRLHEIDYGSAEGLTFEKLEEYHPKIIQAWSEGSDPCFPGGGENTGNVLARLERFINEILDKNFEGSTLVVTHNVVLRCIIGQSHSIPIQNWHHLIIPHAKQLKFKLLEGKLYPNIPRIKLGEIFKKIGSV